MSLQGSHQQDFVKHGFLYSKIARHFSFLLAAMLSLLILIYPRFLASSAEQLNHGLLSLWMWGIAAGFIHGVGYIPRLKVWRVLFGPLFAWLLMLMALAEITLF
jgi:cyd operon protein YbgE